MSNCRYLILTFLLSLLKVVPASIFLWFFSLQCSFSNFCEDVLSSNESENKTGDQNENKCQSKILESIYVSLECLLYSINVWKYRPFYLNDAHRFK